MPKKTSHRRRHERQDGQEPAGGDSAAGEARPSTARSCVARRCATCTTRTNESHCGDTVEILECRPTSRLKRWELVRVVSKSQAVDIAAMRAAGPDASIRERSRSWTATR